MGGCGRWRMCFLGGVGEGRPGGDRVGEPVGVAVRTLRRWPIGAVDVPLYPTLTPEQIGYVAGLGCEGGGGSLFARAVREADAAEDLPELEYVVVMDGSDDPDANSFAVLDEGR